MPDVVIGGSQNQEGQVSVAVDGQVLGSSSCQQVTYSDLEPDIYLDADNRIIAIADKTFGNKGIQLDWNAGFPRIYVGDGSANYFKYDGSKLFLETATVDLDGDTGTLTLSGNLVCDEVQANKFMWGGTYIQIVIDDVHDYIILGDSAEIILDGPNEMISVGTASKIVLDGTNQQIYINDATFGNQGIQLDYNAGTPRVYIGDGANQYFKFDGTNISWKGTNTELTAAGAFTATSATITGTITATAGAIGGWDIAATTLSSGTTNIVLDSGNKKIYINDGTFGNAGIQLDYNGGTPRAYIGDGSNAYLNFDGTKLTWKAANTELDANGKLTCTAGWIGGWVIAATTLKSASSTIELDSANETITVGNIAADGIRISSTGIALYDGGTQKGAWLVDSTWWLGSNSSNKKLEWDPATTTFYVRGNAAFDTLVFQEKVTTRGSVLVTPSAGELFAATTATGTTFTVNVTKPPNGAAPFANGDICLLDDGIHATWFTVGAASDQTYYYQYTATYQSGSNSDTYQAGTAIADYGQSGDGGLLLTADESDAPYLTIFDHAGAPWTTINYRLRLGNLNNFLDYTSDVYGIAIGDSDAYLAYDQAQGLRIRGTITVDSLPYFPPDTALIGYWSMDEGSGTIVLDNSGDGNNGTFTGTPNPTWATGVSGNAVSFVTTTSNRVMLDSAIEFAEDTPWTISFWALQISANKMSLGEYNQNFNRMYHRVDAIRTHFDDGTSVDFVHNLAGMPDSAWHHFVIVCDGGDSDNLDFYVDGAYQDTYTKALTALVIDSFGLPYTSTSYAWDGKLDQIRIYSVALTQKQVEALYLYPDGPKKTVISGYGVTAGAIQSTNWGPGSGSQFDLDAGTFQLGGSASPKLEWDGSNLTVVGSITITGGSGLANLSDTLDDLADGSTYVKATQEQLDAADQAEEWQAVGDTTKIDGGKIYTGSITADKIDVASLSALTADLGTVTAGTLQAVTVIGSTIQTATSGKRVEMTSDGIALVVAGTQQYGEFLYGEGYYGSGALAYIHHSSKNIPFYIDAEQTVADFHFYNRSSSPSGAAEIGDVCVVDGYLKICRTAGTPGTWVDVGEDIPAIIYVQAAEPGTTYTGLLWLDTDATATQADGIGIEVDGTSVELADAWMKYAYQQPSGTQGGTNTASAWTTYPLNTEIYDPNGWGSLSSSQVTLDAGTYEMWGVGDFYRTQGTQMRIRNVTDGTTLAVGVPCYAQRPSSGTSTQTLAFVWCPTVTFASSKVIAMQYYCAASQGTNGLGINTGTGENQEYGFLMIRRVK